MSLPLLPFKWPDVTTAWRRIAETINALIPEEGDWTATIRGAGTAGTYEIAEQHCRYTRMASRVFLDIDITMDAAVTGGGTSYLQITGCPFTKKAGTDPQGTIALDGVGFTADANLTLSFISGDATSTLYINETNNGAAWTDLDVSGIGANDRIVGSICFETIGRV